MRQGTLLRFTLRHLPDGEVAGVRLPQGSHVLKRARLHVRKVPSEDPDRRRRYASLNGSRLSTLSSPQSNWRR